LFRLRGVLYPPITTEGRTVKHAYLALIALLPTIGCTANVSSSGPEPVEQNSQAATLYSLPPAAYDPSNTLIGTYCNPYPYDPNHQYETPNHEGHWALESDGVTKGCFDIPYTVFGVTKYRFDLSCPAPGCTCTSSTTCE
jgi:hypothetical protein